MAVEDYIRVRGDVLDTAPLQGIGSSGSVTVEQSDPLQIEINTGDTTEQTVTIIDDALWLAQSAFIEGESSYLVQLNTEWKETETLMGDGRLDNLLDFLGEILEEGVGAIVFKVLTRVGIVLTGGQSAVVAVVVSVAAGFGWEKLREAFSNWLKEGNKLLEAMKAENDALLLATQSMENYRLRNDIIARHGQTIVRLLDELNKIQANSEKLIETKPGSEEDWEDVLDGLTEAIDELDEWMNPEAESDPADGESTEDLVLLPSAPDLPAIPDDGNTAITRKMGYLMAQYGFKLLTEMVRRSQATDVKLSELIQSVSDLKYNDEVVDFGAVRIHHKAKIIEGS